MRRVANMLQLAGAAAFAAAGFTINETAGWIFSAVALVVTGMALERP